MFQLVKRKFSIHTYYYCRVHISIPIVMLSPFRSIIRFKFPVMPVVCHLPIFADPGELGDEEVGTKVDRKGKDLLK